MILRHKQGKQGNQHFMEVKDIQQRFNLSRNYISDCLRLLDSIFEGHYSRGANNRIIFDDSAFKIFERISNIKSLGKTLPQIKKTLVAELGKRPGNEDETSPTTPGNRGGNATADKLLNALTESHKSALNAKEETIKAQKETIQSLHKELLSLPDGRTPKEIQEEWNKQRKHAQLRVDLFSELNALQRRWIFDKTRRQKQIVQQLKDLDS